MHIYKKKTIGLYLVTQQRLRAEESTIAEFIWHGQTMVKLETNLSFVVFKPKAFLS